MTKYIQTNEHGYVIDIIEEPLLLGLFGDRPENYRKIPDNEVEILEGLLKFCKSSGNGLHIDDVPEFKTY